jgi:methylamine dehydrogenase light chain
MPMKLLDTMAEESARALARRSSRRGLLGSLGALLVGAVALPLLPVARGAEPERKPAGNGPAGAPEGWDDPTSCNYWRHCGVDGFCTCCGGTRSAARRNRSTSPGSTHNPADGRTT